MSKPGRKHLTYTDRQKLFRKTPRNIRGYDNELTSTYQPLIESFTLDDYRLYEKLMHAYKRVDSMAAYCKNREIQGPVLELSTIRSQDLRLHQRLLQVLRHRWTDIWEVKQNAINEDSEKFWIKMASGIQRRCVTEDIELHSEWAGAEGRLLLVQFLKNQYEQQLGKCAVSKEDMALTVGTKKKNGSKCSPDRKNSNKGYTPDNIWFVTWWVNSMKMDMPMITFWKRIDTLTEARKINSQKYINKKRYGQNLTKELNETSNKV